eukprot:2397773-Ditylum_brightwellii.AAC.1
MEYRNKEGPRICQNLPAYITVDCQSAVYLMRKSAFHNIQESCCLAKSVSLHVCNAIKIHKCQEISVGPGAKWKKVIIPLLGANQKTVAGMELVAISYALNKTSFVLDDKLNVAYAKKNEN